MGVLDEGQTGLIPGIAQHPGGTGASREWGGGQVDDFDAFVRATGPSLARLATLLSGNPHTAEDLVQSSLLQAHRSWNRVRAVEHPEAYVRQILVREYLTWRRRKSTGEMVTDPDAVSARDRRRGPDPASEVTEADAMWRRLQQLPRKQRAVLVMRYYLDLPDHEIAALLQSSTSTVRSHISRGLQTLRVQSTAMPEDSPR
jgi:RNA polymerase sigma-70 factor (sigma-E family)